MSTTPDMRDNWKLDLSLSGGGVRSSFFSLGVILYLIEAGLSKRIASIASVSGGSITNAALAARVDITTGPKREIYTQLQEFARHLAHNGSFFGVALKRITKTALPVVAVMEVLAIGVLLITPPRQITGYLVADLVLIAIEVPMILLMAWATRRRRQVAIYDRFLKRIDRSDELDAKRRHIASREARRPLLRDLPETSVAHIFCATELTSGVNIQPVGRPGLMRCC